MMPAVLIAVAAFMAIAFINFRAYWQARQALMAYRAHFTPSDQTDHPLFRVWFQGVQVDQALMDHMVRSYSIAISVLEEIWGRAKVQRVLTGVYITVKAQNDWIDGWGRHVAGLKLDDGGVVVGRDLAALSHEFAHSCERDLDGVETDEKHSGWEAKGIARANTEFHRRMGQS